MDEVVWIGDRQPLLYVHAWLPPRDIRCQGGRVERSIAAASALLLTGGMLAAVASPASASPSTPTPSALQAHRADIRAADSEAYTVSSSKKDANGASHTKYTRTYHGLRVYGGDFIVH